MPSLYFGKRTVYKWDSSLETGHQKIDEQHRKLLTAYNTLVEALRQQKGKREVFRTVDFLSGYVFMHFEMEEALQLKSGYPGYDSHKLCHDEFKATVNRLIGRFQSEGPTEEFVATVTNVVGDWLVNHVKSEDFRLAAYIKSRAQ